jgi:hypothetical protein
MDAYDRCTNLGKKNLADRVVIYGRGRDHFRQQNLREILVVNKRLAKTNGLCSLHNGRKEHYTQLSVRNILTVQKYVTYLKLRIK